MRHPPTFLLLAVLAAGCDAKPISVNGQLADGRCAATIDGTALSGPEGAVRMATRTLDPEDPENSRAVVLYCLLDGPDGEPSRIDFVKLRAPATGGLEPGEYTIDGAGDQPRTIGVILTTPLLDVTREWQPVSGTLWIARASAEGIEATFEMEVVAQGARDY